MSKVLVASYCVETTDNETYLLTFSIPDNCEYRMTMDVDVHVVIVSLQTGETKPSEVYIPCSETIVSAGNLAVDFDQQDCIRNANLKKPKIRIEF